MLGYKQLQNTIIFDSSTFVRSVALPYSLKASCGHDIFHISVKQYKWYVHIKKKLKIGVCTTHHNEEGLRGGSKGTNHFRGKDPNATISLPLVVEGGAGKLSRSWEVNSPVAIKVKEASCVSNAWKEIQMLMQHF
ncbi:hypothetical protein E2C01_011816 [Portunus trituberculatus]|uniref:Uncharacterized protein n=1 Tax=Portunus trituberculatus TaxID=210409 RepID=A0A5B7DCH5_PORTR|nr:hypothetical protein [Portunus trituberculatus]